MLGNGVSRKIAFEIYWSLGEFCLSVTKISDVICDKNSPLFFCFLRGTRKHFCRSKKYFWPIRMFSCPPLKNKNKQATSLHRKSRHLLLWQTNRTRLLIPSYLRAYFHLTYDWNQSEETFRDQAIFNYLHDFSANRVIFWYVSNHVSILADSSLHWI